MVIGGSLSLIGSKVAALVDAWASSLADDLLDFRVVSGGSLFLIDSVVVVSVDTWMHSLADNLFDLRGNLDTWGSSPMSIFADAGSSSRGPLSGSNLGSTIWLVLNGSVPSFTRHSCAFFTLF